MMLEKVRIGVLMGGPSAEREVSLKSGKAIFEAFKSVGQEAVAIDIQRPDRNYVKDLLLSYDIGLAFLALHGSFGEDGRVQGILEEMGLPYTGSGPAASALAMDKIASRKIFQEGGLAVPGYCVLDKNRRNIKSFSKFPLVVKPACGGSSIGLSIADNHDGLKSALDMAFKYDRKALIEEYVEGVELTVGILDDSPLEAIEIRPKRRFFDYKAKYVYGQTEYIMPAQIPSRAMGLVQDTAARAHNLLGCSFFSRVDIILDAAERPFVLEVNTIPGFTATSLLPKAALQKGISFTGLITKISRAALARDRAAQAAELLPK